MDTPRPLQFLSFPPESRHMGHRGRLPSLHLPVPMLFSVSEAGRTQSRILRDIFLGNALCTEALFAASEKFKPSPAPIQVSLNSPQGVFASQQAFYTSLAWSHLTRSVCPGREENQFLDHSLFVPTETSWVPVAAFSFRRPPPAWTINFSGNFLITYLSSCIVEKLTAFAGEIWAEALQPTRQS